MLAVLASSEALSAAVNRQGNGPPFFVSGKTSKTSQWRLWESSRLHPVYVEVFPTRRRTTLSHKFLISRIEQDIVSTSVQFEAKCNETEYFVSNWIDVPCIISETFIRRQLYPGHRQRRGAVLCPTNGLCALAMPTARRTKSSSRLSGASLRSIFLQT